MSDRDTTLVRLLVACYPAGWRRRYGDEYAQLLTDLRIHRRPALVLDSLRGAALAHGGVLMTGRSPLDLVVWATGLFVVAGLGFEKIAEDVAGHGGPLYAVLGIAAAVALLALAAASAPTAIALVRGRDAGAWKFAAVPVVGVFCWLNVLAAARVLAAGHGVHSAANVGAFLLIVAVGVVVVATTAWAAVTVLRRVPSTEPAWLRTAALTTVAGGMAAATVAGLAWGLEQSRADDGGILATPFLPSWAAVVLALGTATGLAGRAASRQLSRARRA
ncbi:hypothetical protein [Cryptosporangium phraense]|uniref:Uncharacterized protein n=1 Tax=Cryptosporangium phraense TaxID=2593070 RepID=A0A545APV6_9ACTN|nr:hypothetical protein [Cryptosporangium phraense]TQS43362.1 hypothetical protein FL583_19200 [Cryptosporangium phraense]